MAGAVTVFNLGFKAGGAVTANHLVKFSALDTIVESNAAGEFCLGVASTNVSSDEATAGKQQAIHIVGAAWVEVGTAGITAGQKAASDGAGCVVAATAGDYVVGMALKTGADGDLVPVLLTISGIPLAS